MTIRTSITHIWMNFLFQIWIFIISLISYIVNIFINILCYPVIIHQTSLIIALYLSILNISILPLENNIIICILIFLNKLNFWSMWRIMRLNYNIIIHVLSRNMFTCWNWSSTQSSTKNGSFLPECPR